MDVKRRTVLTSAAAMLAASAAKSATTPYSPADSNGLNWPSKERFPLWPGKPPGAPARPIVPNPTLNDVGNGRKELWVRGVAIPEVHVFRPALADGSALLSLPGGGYEFLSVQNEGMDVAEYFNGKRTTVFVLAYRLPGEGWANRGIVPLADTQRAIRLIRSRAADFRIDPARLGVIGFSAGGHLAADIGVSYDERVYTPVDAADQLSARPAYLGLVYAVTSLLKNQQYNGQDWMGLTGPATQAELETRSPILHITKDTPPSFLVQAADDPVVNPINSFNWAGALMRNGVSAELHMFAKGSHGFGLHLPPDNPGSLWPELFALWMRQHGG
jgi:acetyl esterase/lipase